MPNLTPQQYQAVHARNRELLVSASAGTGKTTVLIDRILDMIRERHFSVDRMLIMTFTRAAAMEMKERLTASLSKAAEEDPRMREESEKVATASIMTIDSFCQKVVRTHFQHVQVDPQFIIADERMVNQLSAEAMSDTLDELYDLAQQDLQLKALISKFTENQITEMLSVFYGFLMSLPDPFGWLKANEPEMWTEDKLRDAPFVKSILQECGLLAKTLQGKWDAMASMLQYGELSTRYAEVIMADSRINDSIIQAAESGLPDLLTALQNITYLRLPARSKKDETAPEAIERFKKMRDTWKDTVKKLKDSLPYSMDTYCNDLNAMIPAELGLARLVHMYHDHLTALKQQAGMVDFNDTEHFALQILRSEPLRLDVAGRYDAVFVDEYQDVSPLQEEIISRMKLPHTQGFSVGDVKQSIYRFRRADPRLFQKKTREFSIAADADCRKIFLTRNFRSVTNIHNSVNRVFTHVMDERVTEISYDDDSALVRDVPTENDPVCDVHILRQEGLDEKEIHSDMRAEAMLIGKDILASLGRPIPTRDGGMRPLEYGDIAILLPTARTSGPIMQQVLRDMGIPTSSEGTGNAAASLEVLTVVHFLQLLISPRNDIALLAALRSPFFRFNDRELADIRLCAPGRGKSFLTALQTAAETAEEPLQSRCREVLAVLERERFCLKNMHLSDYLWDLLQRTGLYLYESTLPDSARRTANLQFLCQRAYDYEENYHDGAEGFVAAMLQQAEEDRGASPAVSETTGACVQIMTVHKSKGLGFPLVYISHLGDHLARNRVNGDLSYNSEVGYGLRYVNELARTKRTTLVQTAVKLRQRAADLAERARLLYVGMTRPMHRLVLVGTAAEKEWSAALFYEKVLSRNLDFTVIRDASTYLDWILQSGDAADSVEQWAEEPAEYADWMRTDAGHQPVFRYIFHDEPIDAKLSHRLKMGEKAAAGDEAAARETTAALIEEIGIALGRPEYSFKAHSFTMEENNLPQTAAETGKWGVTALCHKIEHPDEVTLQPRSPAENSENIVALPADYADASEETLVVKTVAVQDEQAENAAGEPAEKPTDTNLTPDVVPFFMKDDEEETASRVPVMNGKIRGTLTHRVMELIDLDAVRSRTETLRAVIAREVKRIVLSGQMTEQEAGVVNQWQVARFFESDLGKRMLRSSRVEREFNFTMRVRTPIDAVVQGIIDLCFLQGDAWVLADFKTDATEDFEELKKRYTRQISYYKEALETGTKYPVKECMLFSLKTGKEISIDTIDVE